MQLKPPHPWVVFSLVMGGVYPLFLASSGIQIIDRNILVFLRKQARQPQTGPRADALRYWLGFLNAPDQKINPILCAMEGTDQRVPTFEEFRDELHRACDEVAAYFPQAQVLRQGGDHLPSVYEIVRQVNARHERETRFLCNVAPTLCDRKTGRRLNAARDALLAEAANHELAGQSMAAWAALSCLYEGANDKTQVAAKRIIKPKRVYESKHAHNALADLRGLEMLAAGFPLGQDDLSLCARQTGPWRPSGRNSACRGPVGTEPIVRSPTVRRPPCSRFFPTSSVANCSTFCSTTAL